MRSIITLSLLLSCLIGHTQSWAPFDTSSSSIVFKIGNDLNAGDTATIKFQEGTLVEQRLEITQTNGVNELSSKRIRGCSIFDPYADCDQFGSCMDYFSWIGNPVITSDWNTYYAVNRWNDTLQLPSPNEDSTTIWTNNDSSYIAVLTLKTNAFYNGQQDSLAIFQIILEVNGAVVSGHEWANDQISLNQFAGFNGSPLWYTFPHERAMVDRIQENPAPAGDPVSYNSLFTYEVGDLIHFTEEEERGTFGIGSGLLSITRDVIDRYQCEVVNVSLDNNGERVFELDCEVHKKAFYYEPLATVPNSSSDTVITTTITWNKNNQNGTFLDGNLKDVLFAEIDNNGQIKAYYESTLSGVYSDSACPQYEFIFEPWWSHKVTYQSGLGMISHHQDDINDSGGDYYVYDFNLVYYKGDSLEYGTPLPPVGIDSRELNRSVSIYPNPASDRIFISAENTPEKISILDLSGRTVMSKNSPTNDLNIAGISPGTYLIMIEFADSMVSKRFVKAQ